MSNFTYKKNHEKIRQTCLHISYAMQDSFHFDEIFFTKKFKIPTLIFDTGLGFLGYD